MISDELNKSLTVKTTHDVLDRASIKQPETYIPNKTVDDDNVGEVTKVVVCAVMSDVPIMGALISGLLDAFWPGGKEDIWEGIRGKVEALVDDKIQQQEANRLRNDLKGVYLALKDFVNLEQESQARGFHPFLSSLRLLAPSFTDNDSPWYALPYIIPFGTLYLGTLWTRWRYCVDIDGKDTAKDRYKKELLEALQMLQATVATARSQCIETRKKAVTHQQWDYVYQDTYYEAEDQRTHRKLSLTGSRDYSKQYNGKLLEQFYYEIDCQYGAELDKILEPTRFWERYDPGYVAHTQRYLHLEHSGWLWDGIQAKTTRFDTSVFSKTHGKLDRIICYHTETPDGVKHVVGMQLGYRDYYYKIGSTRGTSDSMWINDDEAIVFVSATYSAKYHALETIKFTKARQTFDSQGRPCFDKYTSIGNAKEPQGWLEAIVSFAYTPENAFKHNSEVSKPYPKSMLWASGWSYDDEDNGFIGLFQPVFGCWETIDQKGRTTWSLKGWGNGW